MKQRFLIMNPKDNVATTLEEIQEGVEITHNNKKIIINRKIPFGHKFALESINKGEFIIKYGEIIGKAKRDIKAGDWVHTRNVRSAYMEMYKK
ncbi:MAG: UxaA family hydrolase [Candidatus Helarchaeota archaeon]